MRFFFVLLFAGSVVSAQLRYSQIQIPNAAPADLQQMERLGIAVDHFDGKIGGTISLFVNNEELAAIAAAGIRHSVTIPDWQKYFDEQQKAEIRFPSVHADNVPQYFRYGVMAGFLVHDEVLQQLDSMTLLFPHLITQKESIGVTIQGRPIFAIKISDNPNLPEQSEPEVLYTALHHAREPQGMMTVIYFMWWLLENYGTDPEATYLVNNRQLWFIPVVNPDGYIYNQTINPNGGGMHRKNRRTVGTTNLGVDLNRNYGPHFMWNFPNPLGSSLITNSDTYRGESPFSEPETFAVREFMAKHNFKTCFNYHTSGNYLIYPWGYSSSESNDSLLFRHWTYDMSMYNRYNIGTDLQTVGYSTRGNSDDFMYSDSSKERTYAMTPEVGTTGFWPQRSSIYPLAQENIHQNKLLAHFAGSHLSIFSYHVSSDTIHVRFINKGVAALPATPVTIQSDKGNITSSIVVGPLAPMGEQTVTIAGSFLIVDGPSAERITLVLSDSAGAILKDTITFIAGKRNIVFADRGSSTAPWSLGTGWGTTVDPLSGDTALTDSPAGNYLPESNNVLTLMSSIDLSPFHFADLTFDTKWAIESTWDFGTVEVSTDNGSSWKTLRTDLSRKGSGRNFSKQPATSFGYDAFNPGLTWIGQRADLSDYAGKMIRMRFVLSSDNSEERDGWYLDNIVVAGYISSPNSVADRPAPREHSLSQNFPNPFNPTTTIGFSLQNDQHVVLTVHNLLGQTVGTLIDRKMPAGEHRINFHAEQLSTGVYFYRLTAGSFIQTRKMTVIK